jgi:hypothetical protein
MKHIVGSLVAALLLAVAGLLALAGSAFAHPSSGQTITSVVQLSSFPPAPPFVATYSGTFTTSTGDSGIESVQVLFFAIPSPTVGGFQSLRTLTSNDGQSTLVVRCNQLATAQDFLTYPLVPNSTGSCAVLRGTGAYSGLHGSGPVSGAVLFDPSGTSATLTDTIAIPLP